MIKRVFGDPLLFAVMYELKRALFGKKFFAEVDVTDNCNLRCKHCYHFHGKSVFEKKEIPIEEWEKRFNGLHKSGIRAILLVGGEPALRIDVLMMAQRIFNYVAVITNGTIKIPDEFENRIYVSVDGLEERNDSIRGKGVFSKIIKNYSGDKRVVINMTLMEENYQELGDVVKIVKKHNFKGVVCNVYTPGIDFRGPEYLRNDARRKIIEEMKRVKSLFPKEFLLNKSMIKWYEYPDHRNGCYWGDNVLHLDVSWNKRRCFAKADCSNCGCFAGSLFQKPHTMSFHPRDIHKIISI
jgi:MoaA/NifB/PqqE/SkfB family radical SAM enzyme